MSRILKHNLQITDKQTIAFPNPVIRPLTAQFQRGELMLWVECDDSEQTFDTLTVYVIGTGNPMPSAAWNYVGTVQHNGGNLVWHIFIGDEHFGKGV